MLREGYYYVHATSFCFTPILTSILTPAFLTVGLYGLYLLTITLLHLIFHLSFYCTSSHINSRTQIQ